MAIDIKPRQHRKTFTGAFLLSIGIHAGLIFLFAGVVVFQYFKRAPVQFRTPPTPQVQRIEPRKLEYKVRMQEQQKKSGRPTVSPRLTSTALGSISLPQVKTTIKPTPNKVLSNLTSFGGNGLGDGFGGGTGTGGLGLGMSAVTFFGIKDRGERIAFLVDASKSMLEDERGGGYGYEAVKKELVRMVQGLSEATFFNIIIFEKGVDVYQPKMTLAGPEAKARVEKWIAPYNSDFKNQVYGTLQNNYTPQLKIEGARGGTTRMDLAIAAACEMGADTVFLITDGTPRIFRPLTEQEQEEKKKYDAEMTPEKLKAYEERKAKLDEERRKLNEERAKKGLPPKVQEQSAGAGGRSFNPKFNNDVILKYLEDTIQKLYVDKKKKPPRIHVVGYEVDPATEQFLRALASQNKGQFRKIRSLVKPIVDNGVDKKK